LWCLGRLGEQISGVEHIAVTSEVTGLRYDFLRDKHASSFTNVQNQHSKQNVIFFVNLSTKTFNKQSFSREDRNSSDVNRRRFVNLRPKVPRKSFWVLELAVGVAARWDFAL
jgi:hypothetical protein